MVPSEFPSLPARRCYDKPHRKLVMYKYSFLRGYRLCNARRRIRAWKKEKKNRKRADGLYVDSDYPFFFSFFLRGYRRNLTTFVHSSFFLPGAASCFVIRCFMSRLRPSYFLHHHSIYVAEGNLNYYLVFTFANFFLIQADILYLIFILIQFYLLLS